MKWKSDPLFSSLSSISSPIFAHFMLNCVHYMYSILDNTSSMAFRHLNISAITNLCDPSISALVSRNFGYSDIKCETLQSVLGTIF